MDALAETIDRLLTSSPYRMAPEAKVSVLLPVLKAHLRYTAERNSGLQNYISSWPYDFQYVQRIADLPYLPVRLLKVQPPLTLVDPATIKRTLTSSSTTGQLPSRVALDAPTARRMTRGIAAIVQDFIGSARRPYLVVDLADSARGGAELGARGAAIQGLQPFATDVTYCLQRTETGDLRLDLDRLVDFAKTQRTSSVLVYGFTHILWNHLVKPLSAAAIRLDMPDTYVLHSGGWKRLHDEAVDKPVFNRTLADVLGCSSERVIDFYGMVEHLGIIYPDCPDGNKHVPSFGEVLIRDPLTLEPVPEGEQGIVQVCSVLPTSFPGHLLLTEDLATFLAADGCPCGRRGTCFRFAGRVPKTELRGCGNVGSRRSPTCGAVGVPK